MMFLLLVCFLLSSAYAHNWVNSPSRARQASTVRPALGRRSETPHVQVAKGQRFQVEWAVGHGSTAYFALLKAEDEPKLRGLTRDMLDQYIAEAPGDQATKMPPMEFRKFHRKAVGGYDYDPSILDNNFLDSKKKLQTRPPGFFKRVVTESDAHFYPRPQPFGDEKVQLEFKDEHMVNDRHAAYKSSTMPYLLSVQRYTQDAKQAYRQDFAQFALPDDAESGSYVLWYKWNGYYDVIDVEYAAHVTEPFEHPYGIKAAGKVWERIQHCFFPDFNAIITPPLQVLDDAKLSHCITASRSYYADGFVVAPVELPSTVWEGFADIHAIPWGHVTPSVHNGSKKVYNVTCDKEPLTKLKAKWACQPFDGRTPGETYEVYETTTDPRDPMFYSTCYVPKANITFENIPPPPPRTDPLWRFAGLCMDCAAAGNATWRSSLLPSPLALSADNCVNCMTDANLADWPEPEPFDGAANVNWRAGDKGKVCDGLEFGSNKVETRLTDPANAHSCAGKDERYCHKFTGPVGMSTRITSDFDCYEAVRNDPDCSSVVMRSRDYGRRCVCWRKDSCCGECKLVSSRYGDIFHLD